VESEFLLRKNGRFNLPKNFWGPIFMGVPPLMTNTGKTSIGEDLAKIRPAIAE